MKRYQQLNLRNQGKVRVNARVTLAEGPENTGCVRVTRVTFHLSCDTRACMCMRAHTYISLFLFHSIESYPGYPARVNNFNNLQHLLLCHLPWFTLTFSHNILILLDSYPDTFQGGLDMDACLKIYDEPFESSDFGERQGRQGGGTDSVLFPESITQADIANVCKDQQAIAPEPEINGIKIPKNLEHDVRRFIGIMEGNAVSAYITQDGLSAGIQCSREWKYRNWETYCTFAKLFFGPAHGVICDVFEEQFKATARLHGKG